MCLILLDFGGQSETGYYVPLTRLKSPAVYRCAELFEMLYPIIFIPPDCIAPGGVRGQISIDL
eukprot:scaffold37996_cov191-Amphora_coffeaeformis.AAC.4